MGTVRFFTVNKGVKLILFKKATSLLLRNVPILGSFYFHTYIVFVVVTFSIKQILLNVCSWEGSELNHLKKMKRVLSFFKGVRVTENCYLAAKPIV